MEGGTFIDWEGATMGDYAQKRSPNSVYANSRSTTLAAVTGIVWCPPEASQTLLPNYLGGHLVDGAPPASHFFLSALV